MRGFYESKPYIYRVDCILNKTTDKKNCFIFKILDQLRNWGLRFSRRWRLKVISGLWRHVVIWHRLQMQVPWTY